MNKSDWKNRIFQSCKDAGTYESHFDDVVDTLAGILENRDKAQEMFDASGGLPVVKHINKGGHENIVKNPALVVINECNAQALTFWKELGMTAKSYNAMQKAGFQKHETTLEDVLDRMGI